MTGTPAEWRPRQLAGVREYPMGVELLLYPAAGDKAHALNPGARLVWELCDGTRTALQISEELASDVGRPAAELLPDVNTAIRQFEEQGLLEPQ
jgi:hypothetical protein